MMRLVGVALAAVGAWFLAHAYLLYEQGGPTQDFVANHVLLWIAIGVGLIGLAIYLWRLKRD